MNIKEIMGRNVGKWFWNKLVPKVDTETPITITYAELSRVFHLEECNLQYPESPERVACLWQKLIELKGTL